MATLTEIRNAAIEALRTVLDDSDVADGMMEHMDDILDLETSEMNCATEEIMAVLSKAKAALPKKYDVPKFQSNWTDQMTKWLVANVAVTDLRTDRELILDICDSWGDDSKYDRIISVFHTLNANSIFAVKVIEEWAGK